MKRKVFSWLTVLVMLLAMIPIQVYAEDEVALPETPAEKTTISITGIEGVIVPVKGETPVLTVETNEYTAKISWSNNPEVFAADTEYTATIVISPKEGYTLTGVGKDAFSVAGANTTNDADSGAVTAIFPKTEVDEIIVETPKDGEGENTAEETPEIPATVPNLQVQTLVTDTVVTNPVIAGVIAPLSGGTPVTITDATEYTTAITWSDNPVTFAPATNYTATITLAPKAGFTLIGVPENFFTVAGAVTTNATDSGIVTAIFPATEPLTAPVLVGATTDKTGETVTLEFDKVMADPLSDTSNFKVEIHGITFINWSQYDVPVSKQISLSSAALNTDPMKIDLLLQDPLQRGDIITISYSPGSVKAADGASLGAITSYEVTNTIPVIIDSNLDGTWEAYDTVGWWAENGFPTGDDPRGHEYNRHIVINGNAVTFYGNGMKPFVDFLYLPSSEAAAKGFSYDLDLVSTDWHTLEGGGFLFNSVIEEDLLSGYVALFAQPTTAGAVYTVNLYEFDGVDVTLLHGPTTDGLLNNEGVTLLDSYPVFGSGSKHSINLETSSSTLNMWDGGTQLITNYELPSDYGNGVGLIGSYISHGCSSLSYFTFSNLKIQGIADLAAVLAGTQANLVFTAPDGAKSVSVEQSIDGVNFTPSTLVNPIDEESTTATVTGLAEKQTYYFRLVITGGKFDGYSRVATAEYLGATTPASHHHSSGNNAIKNMLRFQFEDTNCYLTSGTAVETTIPMDVTPIIRNYLAYLPIRYVVEPLEGEALWDQSEQKATISLGTTTVELWIGKNTAKVNGIERLIDPLDGNIKPIMIEPGRVMVPLRFISETLNCSVEGNASAQDIIITDW